MNLKDQVKTYWNRGSCGTGVTAATKHSRDYFEEIEEYRYSVEPEIFSFAQFTRFRGQKVLEVGVGAGTDFLQWVRAGAHAYGVDLTQEAVDNVRARLDTYGLTAEELQVADAENLPYADGTFDLVYSWGVIHHSPDTEKALSEIVRVTRPGGRIKLMVYNRHALFTYYRWMRHALLRGRPQQSLSRVMFEHQESVGTKVYTISEFRRLLSEHPLEILDVEARLRKAELLPKKSFPLRVSAYLAGALLGTHRAGFFLTAEAKKL